MKICAIVRDRRGAGVAEYAILLFIVLCAGAIAFRVIGHRIRHSGEKTTSSFTHAPPPKPTLDNAPGTATAAASDTAQGGGGAGGGAQGGGHGALEQAEEASEIPLWKIIGGVILVLFGVGGFLAFRKGAKGG